ncbi:MAG: formylglycine-generating enzyme family protein [Nannocystaceae bacterium]|nr:formylglycine-generating enzyme family protein [Nannocystaceae bacterium]
MRALASLAVLAITTACVHGNLDTAGTVTIDAGSFTMGSSLDSRSRAIEQAARSGSDARGAVASVRAELSEHRVRIAAFHIMIHPVTQDEYARFVWSTGAPEPWIDAASAARQESVCSVPATQPPSRYAWHEGRPQPARVDEPAVLVSRVEAEAYCQWWGEQHGGFGSLPSEAQWERAARGVDGRDYPWGDRFVPEHANTREHGMGDVQPVAARPGAASPEGVLDVAGNVAEWTAGGERGLAVVKGAAWSDPHWAARAPARRLVPPVVRHVAIGFRCVLDPTPRP